MVLSKWTHKFIFFGLYSKFSILCCAVQWKDGKKPWDDREGSVKTLQKAYSMWDEWYLAEWNKPKRSRAQWVPGRSTLYVVGNVCMTVVRLAFWNHAPYYPHRLTQSFNWEANHLITWNTTIHLYVKSKEIITFPLMFCNYYHHF